MDNPRDLFGIFSKCRFIPNGIRCLKIKHHLRLFIAVWHSCYVTIFNCIEEKNKALFKGQTVEKDDLKFSHPIVNVFMTNHCIYAADSIGTIYDLQYRVHHLDEAKNRSHSDIDMFDLSPGCLFGWVQSKIGILSQCDTLLAISAIKQKLIAISVFSDNLLGHVYELDTFCCLYTVTLLEAAVDKVVFTCIDVPLSEELKHQYFPFLSENDVEIPVIGLNCGQALTFSITQQSDQVHTVFSSLQPIVAIEYNFDKEVQKCSSILVLVSSGLLITLTGKSSQLLYISAPVYVALFNRNQSVLVSSDGADFMLTKIKFDDTGLIQESSIKSKVKAVQSVCTLSSMSDIILVGTQHCCVYWMDLSEIFLNYNEDLCKFVMPKEQIFNELLLATKKLEEANIAMQREDSIMRAVSLISRTKFLNKYFTILVKCYSGKSFSEEKLKLRIESDSDIASFTPDIWSLNLTLSLGNNKTISCVHKLDKIFTKDFPLTVDFKCSPVVESELSCKMIAKIDDKQPLLIVPLGKVELDAGYFFSLVKNKSELLKQLVEPPMKSESCWDDYDMDNDNHDIAASAVIDDVECNSNKKMVFYSLKLDSSLPYDKVFHLVFRNSSHRMTKNQWMCISDLKEITATIGHHYWVEISLDKEQYVLNIKSNNIYACYLIKKAIKCRLGTDNPVELDSDTYMEAEGIKYRFELARLKMDWDLKTFQDIKNEFRHDIMDKLSI